MCSIVYMSKEQKCVAHWPTSQVEIQTRDFLQAPLKEQSCRNIHVSIFNLSPDILKTSKVMLTTNNVQAFHNAIKSLHSPSKNARPIPDCWHEHVDKGPQVNLKSMRQSISTSYSTEVKIQMPRFWKPCCPYRSTVLSIRGVHVFFTMQATYRMTKSKESTYNKKAKHLFFCKCIQIDFDIQVLFTLLFWCSSHPFKEKLVN